MVRPNYCIVVGSQRSGTTLVAQMLGAHSNSVVIDEEDGLYAWTSALMQGAGNSSDLYYAAIQNAQNKYVKPEKRFSTLDIIPRIQVLVLKAPNLTYSWSELASVMPEARIVYVYRGAKAIVASMKKLQSVSIVENQTRYMLRNKTILQRFSHEMQLLCSNSEPACKKMTLVALIKMSFIQDFRKAGFDVEMLQYEKLVSTPKVEVARLLRSTGLGYEDQCVDYHQQYQGVGPGFTLRTRKVDKDSVYTWRHVLSEKEQRCVDEVVRKFLDKHGRLFEACSMEYIQSRLNVDV